MLFHGVVVFFTFENTYDAFVHIFFGSHYAEHWFDHWNYKWYSGFSVTSYPPMIHQLIGLLSHVIGLKLAFVLLSIVATALFIRGVYVFSKLWVDRKSAGVACMVAAVSSSFVEALHVFGQLPSISGIALLLNLSPHVYNWIKHQKWIDLLCCLGFFAVITATHHVTTIFGMVFFIFPVIGLVIMDNAIQDRGGSQYVRFRDFIRHVFLIFKPAIILGLCTIVIAVMMIFPYWVWSANDPITQVPIPHGSRDSFLEVFSSGLVFFIIPWGMMMFCLPFLFRIIFTKRTIILALSFTLAFILGTGSTTPIPLMLLRENAFNILTLDRFTYWATIMALPFYGYFINSMFAGHFKRYLEAKIGYSGRKFFAGSWLAGIFIVCGLVINVGYFQPMQPKSVDIEPLLNFLKRDKHDNWRFLTLGFGDQMAWLSANTDALTVDGNYHSARRLAELTTRKVERIESAKYLQEDGILALHQFLTVPEKYNLKYIFCNDRFYNPILYFSGWQKLRDLENHIQVWEKPDIAALPTILSRKEIPKYQQLMWSTLPFSSAIFLLLLLIFKRRRRHYHRQEISRTISNTLKQASWPVIVWAIALGIVIAILISYSYTVNKDQYSPENVIHSHFDALDFKKFEKAFRFYHPDQAPSLEQMMLDLSQEDGVTLSYSKLDTIHLKTKIDPSGERAKVNVKAEWLTSINAYTTYHNFDLIKKKDKWWLSYGERELSAPAEQMFSSPELTYKNQGSREALVNETAHNDILDRPELCITEASLIYKAGNYHIIGSVTNIDNDPSYVTITGTLWDRNNKEIVSYNVKEVMAHTIHPKGKTSFRIDFEDVYFQKAKSEFPKMLDQIQATQILEKPTHFTLAVKSIVTQSLPYTHLGISNVAYDGHSVTGVYNNTGTKECNIPQVIATYYSSDSMMWVENQFLERAVRPQRSKRVTLPSPSLDKIDLIHVGSDNQLFINGLANDTFRKKYSSLFAGQDSKFKLDHYDEVEIQLGAFVVQNLR